jgi:hypothetical protein
LNRKVREDEEMACGRAGVSPACTEVLQGNGHKKARKPTKNTQIKSGLAAGAGLSREPIPNPPKPNPFHKRERRKRRGRNLENPNTPNSIRFYRRSQSALRMSGAFEDVASRVVGLATPFAAFTVHA